MLPTGYKYLHGLTGDGAYINTGVAPTELTDVACLFNAPKQSTATGYIFGSRVSSSNTSTGQLNFYLGAENGADYFGWRSARVSSTIGIGGSLYRHFFSNKGLSGNLLCESQYVSKFKGASGTFPSTTQNMYLFVLNNAGSLTKCVNPVKIFSFKIWQDGSLVRDFVPCINESTGKGGMYDLKGNTFYGTANSTDFDSNIYNVTITSNGGGKGYAKVSEDLLTEFAYQFSVSTLLIHSSIQLVAQPEEGYVFKNWTSNGSVLSTEENYTLDLMDTNDLSIECNFVKKTDLDFLTGYKAVSLKYADQTGMKVATFYDVVNFSINEDLLQKSTSTLTVASVPSTAKINTPIFLYNPKGKIIYYGLIKAITDNVLTCREPIAIYDEDYLLPTSFYNAHRSPVSYMDELIEIGSTRQNYFVRAKVGDFRSSVNVEMQTLPEKNLLVQMPKIDENSVGNREDAIIEMFNQFGVAPRYYLYDSKQMGIAITLPSLYDTLVIGDNVEIIKDVSIDTQEADATIIDIYDSTGATHRDTWGMNAEGQIISLGVNITPGDPTSYIAYHTCKLKTVMSDDDLETIAKQNLNSALYSHKITFTLDLNGLIRFDDLKLGQPVRFYYKNSIYDTHITSWNYSLENGRINSMKITLGNVRTKLTSKLNTKKVNHAA